MSASDAANEAVSGAVGSVLATALTYPLKTIYTLKALDTSTPTESSAATEQSVSAQALQLLTNGKWRFLYAGLKPALLETAVSSGVYFYLYSILRQLAVSRRLRKSGGGSSKTQNVSVAESLLIAALAGAGNMLVSCPAQVVATQMQAQHLISSSTASKKSAWQTVKGVYQESGIFGFWKGLLPSLILVTNPAIQYMLYEQLIRWRRVQKSKRLSVKQSAVQVDAKDVFMISAFAKLGATVVTYPMIVVKSRLQAMNSSNKELHYGSTWDAITTIQQQEGSAGFFKGLDTKLVQTVVNAALLLMMKEQIYAATRGLLKGRS